MPGVPLPCAPTVPSAGSAKHVSLWTKDPGQELAGRRHWSILGKLLGLGTTAPSVGQLVAIHMGPPGGDTREWWRLWHMGLFLP